MHLALADIWVTLFNIPMEIGWKSTTWWQAGESGAHINDRKKQTFEPCFLSRRDSCRQLGLEVDILGSALYQTVVE